MSVQRAEQVMSAEPVERIERYEATLEEYLALPEDVKAEYVEGTVLVMAPPRWGHNQIVAFLLTLFRERLPGAGVGFDPGFRTAKRRYRVPGLVVLEHDEAAETEWITQTPLAVVEVLSPGTQAEDWIRKAPEYLAAGVSQYWLVDRKNRMVTVLSATEVDGQREWEILLILDDDSPTGEVQVGEVGTVPLDLAAIMPA